MGVLNQVLTVALALGAEAIAQSTNSTSSSLPIVDLGYEIQQATSHNTSGGYYSFNNIRYAAPPVGNLRFAAPQAPAVNRTSIQNGSVDRICPQANPAWLTIAAEWIPQYLVSGKTNFTPADFASTSSNSSNASSIPAQDPATTEDCLFLDVVVPEAIFDARDSGYGAPVLVWIYGGGYTLGSKSGSGNPSGLLARSENGNSTGVIYVAMNYRLGAFGWSSGPTFQQNGTANAGLLDQRFALEWVQENIHLFGGDPNRVTVFGESAGGGSIMHQITAYGGLKGPVPFAQAVPQSPGWLPVVSNNQEENIWKDYLQLLNVSTIEEARNVSFEQAQRANILQVAASQYGDFTYGPVVDGDFVPALPGVLLLHGQFDKSLRVLVGHNGDEGLLFTSPFAQNTTALTTELLGALPTLLGLPDQLNYIINTLYPPIFDGSQAQGYTNQIARAAALLSELVFTCNTFYLDKAFGNQTHSYLFNIPPALHGQDIPYTYYTGVNQTAASGSVTYPAVAIAMQDYITKFAETGNPNEEGVPYFPIYGQNATIQTLNTTSIFQMMDPAANYRCDYWQRAIYY